MGGIPEVTDQSWTGEDFGNFPELGERGNDVKIAAGPACNDAPRRAGGLQKSRDPNVGVK